jgi:hypothetical protein
MQGQCFGQYLKYAAQSSGTSGTLVRCPFVDDSAARCDVIIDPSLVDAFNAAVRAAGLGVYRLTCGKPAAAFFFFAFLHAFIFWVFACVQKLWTKTVKKSGRFSATYTEVCSS